MRHHHFSNAQDADAWQLPDITFFSGIKCAKVLAAPCIADTLL